MGLRQKLKEYFTTDFSLEELTDPAKSMARIRRIWLFTYQTARSLSRHQTMTMASALAYKTLMAIVPLLLIGLAVATALGSEDGHSFSDSFFTAIEEKIPNTPALQPLLELLRGISDRATEIAGIGLLLLFFTAYSLLDSIEWVLNRIWQVTAKRKIFSRVISYLAVVIIVPLLMSLSVYFNTRVERATEQVAKSIESTRREAVNLLFKDENKQEPAKEETQEKQDTPDKDAQTGKTPISEVTEATASASTEDQTPSTEPQAKEQTLNHKSNSQSVLSKIALAIVSTGSTCLALSLLFFFMPFTPVHIRPAIAGGLFSGLLIELMKYGYSLYALHASTNLTRLYGSTLLAFPLTLLWLWLVWVIVLLGAEIAFNLQNYHDLAAHEDMERRGLRNRIYLATRIVILASEDFHHGEAPEYFIDRAARYLNIPAYAIRTLVQQLTDAEILREVHDRKEAYLPALDLTLLNLHDIFQAIVSDKLNISDEPADEIKRVVGDLFHSTEGMLKSNLKSLTMSDIIQKTELPSGHFSSESKEEKPC